MEYTPEQATSYTKYRGLGFSPKQSKSMAGISGGGTSLAQQRIEREQRTNLDSAKDFVGGAVYGFSAPGRAIQNTLSRGVDAAFGTENFGRATREDFEYSTGTDLDTQAAQRGEVAGLVAEVAGGGVPTVVRNAPRVASSLASRIGSGARNSKEAATDLIAPNRTPEKIATEVLQPSNSAIRTDLAKGRTPDQVEFLVKNVEELQGAKSFDEAITKIDTIIRREQQEIARRIELDDFDIDSSFLAGLSDELTKMRVNPNVKDTQVNAFNSVLSRYSRFLDGDTIKRSAAQKLKQDLNKVTEPLQKKKDAGTLTGNESAELRAFDLVRDGLKSAVEGGDENIEILNRSYGAGLDAIKSFSTRLSNANKAIDPNLLQRIVMPFIEFISTSTGAGSAAFVARRAAQAQESLETSLRRLLKEANKLPDGKKSSKPEQNKGRKNDAQPDKEGDN